MTEMMLCAQLSSCSGANDSAVGLMPSRQMQIVMLLQATGESPEHKAGPCRSAALLCLLRFGLVKPVGDGLWNHPTDRMYWLRLVS